ncbi:uncharacterized protein SPPG_09066 [Spizellomyces punctatus DAOM BR117]|uniref:Uncharacterized protein n=1 Tax=Spizellomyces punctatus (strain DAOM BR117) TaxID=645134 RepID=A0A0L0HNB3_SPIPD|nr:uncharacterized protein SPPG_09066 [Spizellomyces punctatus DAOM BR117]KND02435.1 hypothetical protein SPPG_09066 [Spizellomyces punctatus DAOM BR117]|eukprot:XP_016610474.1 hypothetical protein SPPG_09066 [Spizellomyces punctatus DAOM BR117]
MSLDSFKDDDDDDDDQDNQQRQKNSESDTLAHKKHTSTRFSHAHPTTKPRPVLCAKTPKPVSGSWKRCNPDKQQQQPKKTPFFSTPTRITRSCVYLPTLSPTTYLPKTRRFRSVYVTWTQREGLLALFESAFGLPLGLLSLVWFGVGEHRMRLLNNSISISSVVVEGFCFSG